MVLGSLDDDRADERVAAVTPSEVRAVRAALSRLPSEQGEILELIVRDAYSYCEAAETLGVSVRTVMKRLAHARAAVAAALARQ